VEELMKALDRSKSLVRRRSGVSLIEVVIALAILGFGMLGVAAAQIAALRNADVSRERMTAHSLARQQIETFQAMSSTAIEAIRADAGYPNDPLNPIDPDPNDDNVLRYNRSWTITPDTPEDDVYSILVSVSWTGALGPQSVALQAFKSEL
jgi:prepilin-type N-terminal cleavage/methylation domain-containing protein